MANLTQTAYITRLSVKLGAIGLLAYVVLSFSYGYFKNHILPPPQPVQPKANLKFGKLPSVNLSPDPGLSKLVYSLETIDGQLPAFKDIGKVYAIIKPTADLFSQDRMRNIARNAGFPDNPIQVNDYLYRFIIPGSFSTTFEIDVLTNNFSLKYDYSNDASVLAERKLPTNDEAISEAKKFLTKIGLLPVEIDTGNNNIYYLKFTIPGLAPAISLSEADFVKVVLLKADIDGFKVLPEKPNDGPITFLFSGSRDPTKRIVEINYKLSKIDTETFATYPLKNVSVAWDELKSGKGYVANLGDNPSQQITIRRVSLAYYDPSTPHDFVQPIYVFEGDNGFMAYVSAIDPKWTD